MPNDDFTDAAGDALAAAQSLTGQLIAIRAMAPMGPARPATAALMLQVAEQTVAYIDAMGRLATIARAAVDAQSKAQLAACEVIGHG